MLLIKFLVSISPQGMVVDPIDVKAHGICPMFKDSCQKSYIVNKIEITPALDGMVDEHIWSKANLLDDLKLHWESIKVQTTKYRALYDKDNFFFLFEVQDSNLVIWDTISGELDVIWEDRVEMFFTPDRKFKSYYCLEIDPYGRHLSNSGSLGQKIDPSWECDGCNFIGTVNKSGYILEGLIPIKTLKKMGVYDGKSIMNVGIFRADFNNNGKPTAPEMHWISWIKSDSPVPNFHIPSALGCFEFNKE